MKNPSPSRVQLDILRMMAAGRSLYWSGVGKISGFSWLESATGIGRIKTVRDATRRSLIAHEWIEQDDQGQDIYTIKYRLTEAGRQSIEKTGEADNAE